MDTREEALFSDLGAICTPRAHLSDTRELYKWNTVPYTTSGVTGTLLNSMQDGRPESVTLEPKLTGWHRIFVGQGSDSQSCNLKLTKDSAYTNFCAGNSALYARHSVEEVYWKAADMTGQTVSIAKYKGGHPVNATLAWLRFVPMDEQEVKTFLEDMARMDTKRIYTTHDMHGMLGIAEPADLLDWRSIVQCYEQSDSEWFSVENIMIFDGDTSTGNYDNFAYPRLGDKLVQHGLKKKFTWEMLSDLCSYGHEIGLKMCISIRMGAWGIEYPYDQMYFTNTFFEENKHLRCHDRDGTPIDALSYAYEEVQEYMLDQFEKMAAQGCDAVEMIFSRGVPYTLFEPPFIERFKAAYGGEDPRYLANDDERVTALRCEMMLEFVRKLRVRLDKKVGIHARALISLYDTRHVGVDVEQMAKEGLITAIISYPQVFREILKGDIWQKGAEGKLLDLDKYYKYVCESPESILYRRNDINDIVPMEDSRGVLQGPSSQQERIAEFMAIEKKYGVTVYIEIMPRFMPPLEYKRMALEIYNAGCEHISLRAKSLITGLNTMPPR